jgi:hypothetical protein
MQAQGSNAILKLANELVFGSAPESVIFACEAAFSQLVDTDVTASLDTTNFKKGTGSARLAAAVALAANDIMATQAVTSMSLAPYTHVGLWILSTVALSSGDLQLLLDDTASCASPIETLNIPAVPANVWTWVKMPLANPLTDVAVISVGIKMVIDKGAFTINVDDIRALNPAVVLPFKSEGFAFSQELIKSECIISSRNPIKPALGNISVDGSISTELDAYMVRLFKHMLGTLAVTGASAPYTYTAKIGALPVGITYEKGFTDIAQYSLNTGCRINTWKISSAAGKLNPLELTFMGTQETISAVSFDDSGVVYSHSPFSTFKAAVKESSGGTTLAVVTEWSLSGNNNLDGDNYVIGSDGTRKSIPAGQVVIEGSLTCLFEDLTLYNKAKAGTPTKLVFEMYNGDGGGATLGNERVTITLDEVMLQPKAPPIAGPKGIKIEIPFIAYYDTGASASAVKIEASLPNNTTLY